VAEELKAVVPSLTFTSKLDDMQAAKCAHMILVLTDQLWVRGEASDKLAEEVCVAMRSGVHRMLVHEV
jgi:hypothetical protein